MEKIVFASDIHGSLYWCGKMAEAYGREGAKRLVLLGDLLYHGPRNPLPKDYDPKGVYELLNSMKADILAVRGNCDSEVDQMVLEFPMMADYAMMEIAGRRVFVTHGHLYNNETPPLLGREDILLNGHWHIAEARDTGKYLYLNPGSASLPAGGSKGSYMVCANGVFEIKELESGTVLHRYAL